MSDIQIDELETQMLRAMQDGDVATGRILTDEVRRLRGRVNELEQAVAADPVYDAAAVKDSQEFYQAAAWFATTYPDVMADERRRAHANAIDAALAREHPQMRKISRMKMAGDSARKIASGEDLDRVEAIAAMGKQRRPASLGGSDFEAEEEQVSAPDEEGLARTQAIENLRRSRMPHNPGERFTWETE